MLWTDFQTSQQEMYPIRQQIKIRGSFYLERNRKAFDFMIVSFSLTFIKSQLQKCVIKFRILQWKKCVFQNNLKRGNSSFQSYISLHMIFHFDLWSVFIVKQLYWIAVNKSCVDVHPVCVQKKSGQHWRPYPVFKTRQQTRGAVFGRSSAQQTYFRRISKCWAKCRILSRACRGCDIF